MHVPYDPFVGGETALSTFAQSAKQTPAGDSMPLSHVVGPERVNPVLHAYEHDDPLDSDVVHEFSVPFPGATNMFDAQS